MDLRLNLIAAMCKNQGIGCGGDLPWRLTKEFKHFVKMTTTTKDPSRQNVVIMGRKTYESLPATHRPLKNRINLVISTRATGTLAHKEGVAVLSGFDEALRLIASPEFSRKVETIWIAGGADIYKMALRHPLCNRLYLTRVNLDVPCDTFFPEFDASHYTAVTDPLVAADIQEEKGKFQEGDEMKEQLVTYKYEVLERDTSDLAAIEIWKELQGV